LVSARLKDPLRLAGLALLAGALLAACGGGGASNLPPAPKRIALVYRERDGALVLAPARGGAPRRLGSASQALLSPDGTRAVALSTGASGQTLTLYGTGRSTAGRVLATLAPPDWAGSGAQLLGFSPDSRYVVLSADALSPSGEEGALVVLDLRSGAMRTVATAGSFLGAGFAPTLPDRLVYSAASVSQLDDSESLLYVTDPRGRHTRQLTSSGLASSPAWSVRGIVFARLATLGSAGVSPRYGLWLIQADGRGLRRIGDFSGGAPDGTAASAAIMVSANGRRAVADFYSAYSPEPLVDVWEVDLVARRAPIARALDVPGAVAKAISRDGRELLVVIHGADGPKVESLRWGTSAGTVLAGAGNDPSWNH
jgi:hypothetical protein